MARCSWHLGHLHCPFLQVQSARPSHLHFSAVLGAGSFFRSAPAVWHPQSPSQAAAGAVRAKPAMKRNAVNPYRNIVQPLGEDLLHVGRNAKAPRRLGREFRLLHSLGNVAGKVSFPDQDGID